MAPLSRPPSRDLTQSRRLSREETFHLAETARRKTSDKTVREDLRLSLSHGHLLEQLLQEIARTERELQTSPTEDKYLLPQERKSSQQQRRTSVAQRELVDDVFSYRFNNDTPQTEDHQTVSETGSKATASRRKMDLLRCPHIMADNLPRRPHMAEEMEDGLTTTGEDIDGWQTRTLGNRMVHTGYWRSFVLYTCVPVRSAQGNRRKPDLCDPVVQILLRRKTDDGYAEEPDSKLADRY
ncbi:hypothetical protein G647_04416 [Cladophialophora carrionii CBS 160.54]|uniref:Uncharacterized protein n=1 Tax=Cladophialophora carrionii CBS 160.54 TaxID=1279043 RepID=V9DEE6_9EURO|nr:uncharacterized protein G647_04416 [Cladophialophora carrionii CBS 160.54]ETI25046.1 hypothetical protein G647_04416 [Cladophialophora carrionii CBS 160.54]